MSSRIILISAAAGAGVYGLPRAASTVENNQKQCNGSDKSITLPDKTIKADTATIAFLERGTGRMNEIKRTA